MDVLGIVAADQPSAACLVREGRPIAGAQEARFTRIRGDASFPRHAIAYCLRAGKIGPSQVDAVVVGGSADTAVPAEESTAPPGGSSARTRVRRWLGRPIRLRHLLSDELDRSVRIEAIPAELAHAAAAFLPSPFSEAIVLVLGDDRTPTVVARGREASVEIVGPLEADDGVADEVAVRLAHQARHAGEGEALAIGGPGAGWRATNGRIVRAGVFSRVWIQPAAASGAAALGAALAWTHQESPISRPQRDRAALAFGPGYNTAQIRTFLRSHEATAEELRGDGPARVADLLLAGHEVGWFDGRIDFGDDTAGSRSILRAPGANGAPPPREGEVLAVLAERASEILEVGDECPSFAELTLRDSWRERLGDPSSPERPRAVVVIDRRDHRNAAAVLDAVARETGMPALAARPLRPPGEPVACTPHDAWSAFLALDLETLVLGDFLLSKAGVAPVRSSPAGVAVGEDHFRPGDHRADRENP